MIVGSAAGFLVVGVPVDGVAVATSMGNLVGLNVGISTEASVTVVLDDDIILFVSFNCSDRLSWVWSLDKRFSIYDDESNTRFKFIRVIESRKDKKSYHPLHSPDVSIDRRLGCWIIANVKDNDNKIEKRNNIFLCSVA